LYFHSSKDALIKSVSPSHKYILFSINSKIPSRHEVQVFSKIFTAVFVLCFSFISAIATTPLTKGDSGIAAFVAEPASFSATPYIPWTNDGSSSSPLIGRGSYGSTFIPRDLELFARQFPTGVRVDICKDPNYVTCASNILSNANQCMSLIGNWENGMSSMNFSGQMDCTLYDLDGCMGDSVILYAPSPNMAAQNFDDKTKSYDCERFA
jgi:hypothetical protein